MLTTDRSKRSMENTTALGISTNVRVLLSYDWKGGQLRLAILHGRKAISGPHAGAVVPHSSADILPSLVGICELAKEPFEVWLLVVDINGAD